MFRQLLTYQSSNYTRGLNQQLFFPNINQLIKVEPVCGEKSLLFLPFIKINTKTQQFQFFLSLLDDVKQEKIKFITKVQNVDQQNKSYVQISQSPILIDNGCNYFLLNAYCGIDRNSSYLYYQNNNTASKSKTVLGYSQNSNKQFKRQTQNNHNRHEHQSTMSTKQLLYNLLYMISCWIYIPAQTLQQFTSMIKKQSRNCLSHINKLSVVNLQRQSITTNKKYSARISTTAAQTKAAYQHQMMQSEIFFQQQFSGMYDRYNNVIKSSTPKSTRMRTQMNKGQNIGLKSALLMSGNERRFEGRYFSRINQIQATQVNFTKRILQQTMAISSQSVINNFHYLTYQSLNQLFTTLQKSHTLLSLQQFHHMNTKSINSSIIQNLFSNYTSALQQQYNVMDEKSIDQIKQLLDKLYQNLLNEFYQSYLFIETKTINQKQSIQKLLSLVYQAQKSLFSSINKSKKQMFERKLSVIDDITMCERWNDKRTKFESLMGERVVEDQQIGFGLYRESIKNKLGDIFNDLLQETTKKTIHHKSLPNNTHTNTTSRLITRHALTNNMDKRIQILLSQKRNLQQSLHYEQRLQQNLIQYINGQSSYQQQREMRRQIQTISESQEDVQ